MEQSTNFSLFNSKNQKQSFRCMPYIGKPYFFDLSTTSWLQIEYSFCE